ncbi:PIG-L family deacetylase [Alkaliphilus pronyensis]|uniref:PIG-L family deacetylase n=1 Tax=Alkaliphilus pronyensis TaxID=1482732 RepID=A0A6I0F8F6_9FIRM|nr:PIG-L family deacetylase [Alkaliphilus pronyensis]KAB3534169.1 PIG-L family deacetylase [Alkaliphilus pronyensis]
MVKDIIKAIVKYPIAVVNYAILWNYYRWSERNNNSIENMQEGKRERVLVIAPHVDDETIGLGGTLLKHVEDNSSIHCVYITDGSGSNTELPKEEITKARQQEAKKIQELIGINELYFMNEVDGSIQPSESLQKRIYSIVDKVKPDVIYTPFLIDAHSDHVETTVNIIKVLKQWNPSFDNIYMYEINCPIIPKLVNVAMVLDEKTFNRKIKLLDVFKTQESMEFDGFISLNRRKGLLVKGKAAAVEVFVKVNLQQIEEIYEILKLEGFSYHQFRQLSNRYNLLLGFIQGYGKKALYTNKIQAVLNRSHSSR